jgi:hypothetical protein
MSRWETFGDLFRNWSAVAGMVIIVLILVAALAGPFLRSQ